MFTADLTNPDILRDGPRRRAPRRDPHPSLACAVERRLRRAHSRRRITRSQPIEVPLTIRFDADYRRRLRSARHAQRRRGAAGCRTAQGQDCILGYVGLDGVERRTHAALEPAARPTSSRDRSPFSCRSSRMARADSRAERRLRGRAASASPRVTTPTCVAQRAAVRSIRACAGVRTVLELERDVQSLAPPVDGRPADDDDGDAARAVSRTPACPGSARRSAATASSPRSSCSGSTRRSRAAC